MPKFTYKALSQSGATVTDTVEADSSEAATALIAAKGLIPTSVTQTAGGRASSGLQRFGQFLSGVKTQELVLFTKQFRTMLRAGVPLVKLLEVLEGQAENPALKKIIGILSRDIQEGSTLHEAFRRHPHVFSPLYCSMVQAGEASGALPEVLERVVYIIQHENKIRSDIRSALQYPLIILFFLSAAFFTLLTFVIPKFVHIFMKANVALPLPTVICMKLYAFISIYWYIALGGAVVLAVAGTTYLRTAAGRQFKDALILRIPVLGPLLVKAAMSRFSSIFAILQGSGIPIRETMRILSGTIGNLAIAQVFSRIQERLEEGRGIAEPLKAARYFTPMVIHMIAVGEEAGNLEEMLKEVAAHYDSELEYSMKKLSDLIGPFLTIGMAAVVGFFALAIFLPMWDMTKMVK